MPQEDILNSFDSIGSPENDAPVDSTSDTTGNVSNDALIPDAEDGENTSSVSNSREILDIFDSFGSADEKPIADFKPAIKKELTTDADPKSSLMPAADDNSGDADSQGKTDDATTVDAPEADGETKAKQPDETAKSDEGVKTETEEAVKEDWEAELAPETEDYINKLPKNERQRARLAEKNSRMQQSFLNPACPPEQWVTNAKEKSGMRFEQIAEAIIKDRNAISIEVAKADPVKFLGELFERTAEGEHSETYQNLLDSVIKTNTEYAVEVLKQNGYELAAKGESGNSNDKGTADLTGSDAMNMSEDEISKFENSEAMERLLDVYPEEASELQALFAKAREQREKVEQVETAEQLKQREAEESAREAEAVKEQEAQIAQTQKQIETFESVYTENITAPVNAKLEKDLGLAVTKTERESNPVMAFLKDAKKRLILAGGLDGSGDFDNDLKVWGDTRPAFKQNADAMVEFARAGEAKNAAAAAMQLRPFAESFLKERLNLPEIKMIDQIIEDIAFASTVRNRTRTNDDVPDNIGAAAAASGKASIVDVFDQIK